MNTVSWSQLGFPTEPGDIRVKGLGIVHVTSKDIQRVAELGEVDPEFKLADASTLGDSLDRCLLGSIR